MKAAPVVASAFAAAMAAMSVEAATVSDCRDLQGALDASVAGDVVTLVQGLACQGHFDLPSHAITLQSAGSGATLDGSTPEAQLQILSGIDVGATVIRNLTFRNGLAPFADGGAIHITGDSPLTLENNRFHDNEATFAGGAVYLVHSPGPTAWLSAGLASPGIALRGNVFGGSSDGNVADDGGGAYVSSDTTVELTGNRFSHNRTFSRGGGATVLACEGVTLQGNDFSQNRILPLTPTFATLRGGGLSVAPSCDPLPATPEHLLVQADNTFVENVIEAGGDRAAGGGEDIQRFRTRSTGDRFARNAIEGSANAERRGGGVSAQSSGVAAVFEGRNLVAGGNVVEGGGAGGGLSVASSSGATVRLVNATIVNNLAALGGGVAGGATDTLALHNSIVFANIDDVAGFAVRDVQFTDACQGSAPFAGPGNICEIPGLDNPPFDFHQLSHSVTIDAGNTALAPADLASDFDGEMRVRGNRVDMGADEWHPSVCDTVSAPIGKFRPRPRLFADVALTNEPDPWGQPVVVTITGVRQDEPVTTARIGDDLTPDALPGAQGHQLRLRRESSPVGDGRIYRVAFEAAYSRGTCSGELYFGVPRDRNGTLLDSGPPYYDSFTP